MNKEYLSLVMPVYNEKNTIEEIIEKVLKLEILKELIIVDDGSTDGTRDILKNMNLSNKVKKVFHERNMGKGGALGTGFKEVTGDIVAIQDADLEYDPSELEELTTPIRKGVADVVYGSRLSGGKPQRVYMFWHKLGNSLITLTANILFNSTLTDIETCYKAFKREIIKDITIRSKGFSVEPELTAKVLKKNCRIYEIPISYYGRSYNEGKKITWKDGFSAIFTLFYFRFFN
jgi:glycosyltransferase involved in cell wall biosynthesis